jgi:hypothetical protein
MCGGRVGHLSKAKGIVSNIGERYGVWVWMDTELVLRGCNDVLCYDFGQFY